MSVFYDADGMIIATEDLECPHPWEIRTSAKFKDRQYFFNLETKSSAWTLPPELFGLTPEEGKSGEGPAESKLDFEVGEGKLAGAEEDKKFARFPRILPRGLTSSRSVDGLSKMMGVGSSSRRNSSGVGGDRTSPRPPPLSRGSSDGMSGGMKSSTSSGNLSQLAEREDGVSRGFGMGEMKSGADGLAMGTKTGRLGLNTGFQSSGGAARTESQNSLSSMGSADEGKEAEASPSEEVPLIVVGGLGMGGYAVVVECHHTTSKGSFALKVLSKAKAGKKREQKRLAAELRAMTMLGPSPFIQRCHAAFESNTSVFFVLDLIGGGDLFFHLVQRIQAKGWGFEEHEARTMLAEVTLGLQHMHSRNFIHRDIKVENVMLDSMGHIKLVDFGLACEVLTEEEDLSPTGSLIYMAPEMIRDHKGGRHTDWWALGVLSYELLTGRTPWSSLTDKKVIRKEIRTMRVTPPLRLSPRAGHFVCSLLRHNPKERLGTKTDVKTASFFEPVDWEAMAKGETPPAFAMPSESCTHPQDRSAALKSFLSRDPEEVEEGCSARDAKWTLGLPKITKHPEYDPSLKSTHSN